VVLPTYNRAHFLPDAIGSVIDQTYRPVELLVVDDGSTDDTREVVEKLAERSDAGLTVRFLSQSKHGAPAARNLGLLESRGEFIHFLDSDDLLDPLAIETQFSVLRENPLADLAWSSIESFQDGNPPQTSKDSNDVAISTNEICSPGMVSHPEAILFRRRALCLIGPWREDLKRMQDWEYAFRITGLRLKGAFLKQPYYYARSHDYGSIGDLLNQPEGISVDLRSLSAIEGTVEAADTSNPDMVYTTFRLYLKLLHRATQLGTEDEIESCLQGLERNSIKWTRKMRVLILRLLYQTFGSQAIRKVIDLYRRIQNR
jgi:glycosyltransferase involved in cell wall biosynthesis